jgi:RNA polymerase sigma factor (sigma-70 family)
LEPADGDLVAACLAGDATAWDALIRRYQGFIFGLALRNGLSQADADDLFQDVSIKLYHHLGELREVRKLSGWLAAVVRQEIWGRWRRKSPVSLSELPEGDRLLELAGDISDPEGEVMALERERLVRSALADIGDECRLLLELLYGPDPAPYAETAERLGMPIGSVGPRRARCLARLKKKLEDFGY